MWLRIGNDDNEGRGLRRAPGMFYLFFYNSFFSYDYLQVKATRQNASGCQNASGRDHHHYYDHGA